MAAVDQRRTRRKDGEMNIILKDGKDLSAVRVFRAYDVSSSEVTLTIELAASVSIEDAIDGDFSEITLKRSGHPDKQFTGYVVRDINESYDDRAMITSVVLAMGNS